MALPEINRADQQQEIVELATRRPDETAESMDSIRDMMEKSIIFQGGMFQKLYETIMGGISTIHDFVTAGMILPNQNMGTQQSGIVPFQQPGQQSGIVPFQQPGIVTVDQTTDATDAPITQISQGGLMSIVYDGVVSGMVDYSNTTEQQDNDNEEASLYDMFKRLLIINGNILNVLRKDYTAERREYVAENREESQEELGSPDYDVREYQKRVADREDDEEDTGKRGRGGMFSRLLKKGGGKLKSGLSGLLGRGLGGMGLGGMSAAGGIGVLILGGLATLWVVFREEIGKLLTWMGEAWEWFKGALSGFWEGVKTFFSEYWDGIKEMLSSIWETLRALPAKFAEAWHNYKADAQEGLDVIWDASKDPVGAAEGIYQYGKNLWDEGNRGTREEEAEKFRKQFVKPQTPTDELSPNAGASAAPTIINNNNNTTVIGGGGGGGQQASVTPLSPVDSSVPRTAAQVIQT